MSAKSVIAGLDKAVDEFSKNNRLINEPLTIGRAHAFVMQHRQNTRQRNSVLKLRVATNCPVWDVKIGILGSTSGTDLGGIFEAMANGVLPGIKVSVVISNKKNAFILERARQRGVQAYFIDARDLSREEYDKRVHNALVEAGVELVLLVGYMRFMSPWFVKEWWGKCLNVHPSLLPKFAGGMDLNVHKAVLAAGETETGATIHFVDEGADSGPIAWQKSIPIAPGETEETLKPKVQALEVEGFIQILQQFRDGKIKLDGRNVIKE